MLKYLVEKEFNQIRRNPFLPRIIFAFPLLTLLFLPLAANFEVNNINLSVVDLDHSPLSKKLQEKIVSSGYFRLVESLSNYTQGLHSVELDKADILLEIPQGFERNLIKEKSTEILLSVNAVNGTKGALGNAYLTGIIQGFSAEVRARWLPGSAQGPQPGLEILPQYRFNPLLRYPTFMVPALMVILLTLLCGFLPALNIVGEKEKGTMEQMNVTPVKKFTLILSKLIPYWVIGLVVLSLGFLVAFAVYGLYPLGNLLTIYFISWFFILGISGFGLVISNYAQTLQQAMFMMFFFLITFIFMSGLYTPINSMPGWAQFISNFVPLRYLIEVFRMVYLKGSGLFDLLGQLGALVVIALFFNTWAVLSYKKTS